MNENNIFQKFNPFKKSAEQEDEGVEISKKEENTITNPEDANEIDAEIKAETKKLLDSAEKLEKDIDEFGGEEEFEKALDDEPRVKESFFRKHSVLQVFLLIQSAGIAGDVLRNQFPDLMSSLGSDGKPEHMTAQLVVLGVTAAYAAIRYLMESREDKPKKIDYQNESAG
jgi:hypothetical protein